MPSTPSGPAEVPVARGGAFAPLTDRAFRTFFLARLVSLFGSAMAPVALTFAVLDLTGSASDLGLVLAARSIPIVLFLLIGGVVADRFPRNAVLTISHLGAGLTQGAAAALLLTGSPPLWALAALEFANGTLGAFTFPALQGVIPQVTRREHFQQANAMIAFVRNTTTIIGPTVAALLAISVGSGWAILVDALTYLAAAALLVRLRLPKAAGSGTSSLLSDLRIGWTEFTRHTWIWLIVAVFSLMNLVLSMFLILGPLIATDTPGVGEAGWGLFLSAEAVGLLVMSVVLLRATVKHPMRSGMACMTVCALPMLAIGIAPSIVVLVVLGAFSGAALEVFAIGWDTSLQRNVPPEALSRVYSYDALGSMIAVPVGQVLAGPLAGAFAPSEVVIGGAVLWVLLALSALLFPSVRNLRG